MSIYAVGGATIEAVLFALETGRVGTYRVSILNTPGTTYFLNPTTAGISESPAGSGLYAWSGTAPVTIGQYSIVWDAGTNAGVLGTEDLYITATGTQPVVSSGTNLTTRAAVKTFLETTDTDRDSAIDAAISQASSAISRYCAREFTPITSTTRTVTVDPTRTRGPLGAYLVDLAPYELRTISAAYLHYGTPAQVTLAASDYLLQPQATQTGTYTEMLIRIAADVKSGERFGNFGTAELSITGTWGMDAVPNDVSYACVLTVASWLRRDVPALEAGLDDPRMMLPDQPMGRRIPGAALALLSPFRRIPV